MNLSYGSKGSSVRDLQKQLNQHGYQLDEDGIFGSNTRAAVQDFQKKNGLKVDGIVGDNTRSKLGPGAGLQPVTPGVSTQSAGATYNTTSSRRRGVSDDTWRHQAEYEAGWKPSADVDAAWKYLQDVLNRKPGEYESPYAGDIQALYEQIMGRDPFQYDLNSDMLYQQYRDQYMNLGQQAMMDTMGQAAGLTGGYASSYGQNAGQQAYQGYLQQLNNKVPELYQLALNKYNAEGDDLYRKYGMVNDRENEAYGRYRDLVADWGDEYNRAYGRYGDERAFDYGKWSDMLNYWMNKANNENADWKWQTEFDYQKQRDAAEDAYRYAALASRGGSGGSSGGRSSGNGSSGNQYVNIDGHKVQRNSRYEIPGYGTVDGDGLADLVRNGAITLDKYGNPIPTGRKPVKGNARMLQ